MSFGEKIMSKYCCYSGRDCEILPSVEKEIYEQGRMDEREEWECAVADRIIKYNEDIYLAFPDVISKLRADAIEEFIKACKVTHDGLICNWDKPYGITFEKMEEKAEQLKEQR